MCIQMYILDKLTEDGWEKLNNNQMLEIWDNVISMRAEELQMRITTYLEKAVMKTATIRGQPKKHKPSLIVRKCLRTKKKISRKLRNLKKTSLPGTGLQITAKN